MKKKGNKWVVGWTDEWMHTCTCTNIVRFQTVDCKQQDPS